MVITLVTVSDLSIVASVLVFIVNARLISAQVLDQGMNSSEFGLVMKGFCTTQV